MNSDAPVERQEVNLHSTVFSVRKVDVVLGPDVAVPILVRGRHVDDQGKLVAAFRSQEREFLFSLNEPTAGNGEFEFPVKNVVVAVRLVAPELHLELAGAWRCLPAFEEIEFDGCSVMAELGIRHADRVVGADEFHSLPHFAKREDHGVLGIRRVLRAGVHLAELEGLTAVVGPVIALLTDGDSHAPPLFSLE